MSERRRQAERAGRKGETLAALYLRLKGYKILESRYRSYYGEIDLIAQKGRAIIFIEVKHRRNLTDGLESVTDFQTDRIMDAAEVYMNTLFDRRPDALNFETRFDIIITGAKLRPVHFKDAWRG
ncbi:YraN family protein [Robiginitomaculum antarcticum]|uniref:YraN family protein n=1 Tax=Robiginitomaculum antarcticum TaxID=437507 RepID=UPI000380B45E|nr:YraN family protein [Robiginitomaculum antarcticum]